MPNSRNMPSIPNVRDSSGTIGTIRGPSSRSRNSRLSIRTNAIVVEVSRSPVPSWNSANVSSGGEVRSLGGERRSGTGPPSAARRRAM